MERLFPALLIGLSLCASAVYYYHGDIRRGAQYHGDEMTLRLTQPSALGTCDKIAKARLPRPLGASQ